MNHIYSGRRTFFLFVLVCCATTIATAQTRHYPLIELDEKLDLPLVEPNDNRTTAGSFLDGILTVRLEVRMADWRIETPSGPGLAVAAFAEEGKPPSIPAPLLRVEEGMRLRVSIRNSLADSTITVFGLQSRSGGSFDSLVVLPGEVGSVEFDAGEPGTYFYHARLGSGSISGTLVNMPEREQLAGAFIIDPVGGSPPDRVFVMNIYSTPTDTTFHAYGFVEALTINGLSWPFTERMTPAVGDTLRWRWINASDRGHPMHLHGFYYHVLSRGEELSDSIYGPEEVRTVVTETMKGKSTMSIVWSPQRSGNWVFHCHLVYHVASDIRLPGAIEADKHNHSHLAGLVIGINVQPGPTDIVKSGEPLQLRLYAQERQLEDGRMQRGFALGDVSRPDLAPDPAKIDAPGPTLLLTKDQPTYITVVNQLAQPTGVHWHGLELESWSDGVAGWSRTGDIAFSAMQPGESFTAELALQRTGTFVYHSHLNDREQLTTGLYGPLLVLEPGEEYDPETDHTVTIAWEGERDFDSVIINGYHKPKTKRVLAGRTHRLRFINIGPAINMEIQLKSGDERVTWQALARDGADLPASQQTNSEALVFVNVGETADFLWTPEGPGIYHMTFGPPESEIRQTWEVSDSSE